MVLLLVLVSRAIAARVELELYADRSAPLTAQQEWLSALAQAGVENLRIHTQTPGDKPGIETRGTEASPVYVVTGALSAHGELLLPGARFQRGEANRLASWLADLGRLGPSHSQPKTVFGLTAAQFEQVQKSMALPVAFATKGHGGREVVENIARQLPSPLRIDAGQLQAMEGVSITAELSGVSCGTALAYVLRPAGLAMVPVAVNNTVEYQVLSPARGADIWPVGWETEKTLQKALPAMFEFFNANVEGVPVSRVLDVISQRLKTPVLLDQNALARYDIQPDKILANAPQGRTSYNLLLRKVLSPAHLKFEVRVDEAGKPLIWVTSVRPI